MSFDVASIKRRPYDPASRSYMPRSNFPFGSGDSYKDTGGLLSAEDMPVSTYIAFAYKVMPDEQNHLVYPKWVHDEHFDIEARGPANATKNQMRLMMQSLLADRFMLRLHRENIDTAIFSVVLVKEGKTGPQLQPSAPLSNSSANTSEEGSRATQQTCGAGMKYLENGQYQVIGHCQTMKDIAPVLRQWPGTGIDRPLLDGTGLSGTFDWKLLWAPEAQPGQPIVDGPSYIEAVEDQLGLKLAPSIVSMPFLILDHIEEPSAN